MCEYCEGKKPFVAQYKGDGIMTMGMMLNNLFGDDDDSGIARIEDGFLFVDNSSGEYAELGFRINYCPNCGEELWENFEDS